MKYIIVILIFVLFSCAEKSKKQIIKTPNAPQAIGPYSQAIRAGNTMYLSGQIAINPKNGQMINSDIVAETDRVMENIGAVLNEANMSYKDIVSATVYLKNIKEFDTFNRIYGKYFVADKPARTTVEVSNLPRGARVEISVIAAKK